MVNLTAETFNYPIVLIVSTRNTGYHEQKSWFKPGIPNEINCLFKGIIIYPNLKGLWFNKLDKKIPVLTMYES